MKKIFDKDGYPTNARLKELESWDFSRNSVDDYLALIKSLWSYKDRCVLTGKHILHLYLSTGGWSGNESVIRAMTANRVFWVCSWRKSVRGGHYWFRIDKKSFDKGLL